MQMQNNESVSQITFTRKRLSF